MFGMAVAWRWGGSEETVMTLVETGEVNVKATEHLRTIITYSV